MVIGAPSSSTVGTSSGMAVRSNQSGSSITTSPNRARTRRRPDTATDQRAPPLLSNPLPKPPPPPRLAVSFL